MPLAEDPDKWWCDDEDCADHYGYAYPHVHPYIGPARPIDIDTGDETTPERAQLVAKLRAERNTKKDDDG